MSADLSDAAGSPMIEGAGLSKVECLTDDDHSSIKDSSAAEEYISEIGGYIKHGSSPDDEDLSKAEEEDLSKAEEDLSEDDEDSSSKFEEEPFEEEPPDFGYISEPEDYSMFESPICRGQTRLFWNLEHYPISESANLVSIHRNIKLALHRVGVHGFLEILAYGGVKPNRDKRDLYEACIHYMPPYKGGQLSIAGQISLDIVSFAQGLYPLRTALVVIAKHIPEIEETKRVLRCLQTRYQHPVLIIDPTAHDGSFFPFESADSVYARTEFVDGGQTRPRIPRSQRWIPIEEDATGVFWDAKDCPFPAGWSADTIYTKIRSAFTEAYCVSGNMSISSYADEMNNESWNKPPESESRINHLILAGDKPARLERMLNDMLLWLIHNPHPSDLIVVADNIGDEIFEMLKSLVIRGHNVFLVTPSKDAGPERHDWPGSLLDQVQAFLFNIRFESESESETETKKRKLERNQKPTTQNA